MTDCLNIFHYFIWFKRECINVAIHWCISNLKSTHVGTHRRVPGNYTSVLWSMDDSDVWIELPICQNASHPLVLRCMDDYESNVCYDHKSQPFVIVIISTNSLTAICDRKRDQSNSLTATHVVKITSRGSWKRPHRGYSIISPSLGFYAPDLKAKK